jgi:YVTN family beta-propeller protein
LLVLNKMDATLAIINPATNQVIAKVPTGEGPHEVATSADGKLAFVANYGHQQPGNTISVIDIAARKELKRIDLGALLRPHGLMEKDGKIFFTSELSRTVGCYDIAKEKVVWINGTGQSIGHMLAVTPDAKKVYVSNIFSNTVTCINFATAPTPENIKHIPVGPKPEAIDISPDGKELWVGHNDDGAISVIDIATNSVKQTIPVGQVPIRIKFLPAGDRVLVSDHKAGELVLMDAVKKQVIKRIKADGTPVGIQITPDGKWAYVARMQANVVSVFDMEKLVFVADITTGQGPDGMAWSTLTAGI